MVNPGIHHDIPFETYLGWDALNGGKLLEVANSPAMFEWRDTHPLEDSDTLRLGRAFHTAILEPDEFDDQYAIGPCSDRRKKEWKDWIKEEAPEGKTILTLDQADRARECRRTLMGRKNPSALLSAAGHAEVSMVWDLGHRTCKGRLDRLIPGKEGPTILELKTRAGPVSRSEWAREIAKRRLHVKAAWYMDGHTHATGVKPRGFIFLVVQNTPPFLSAVWPLVPDAIEQGRKEYRSMLNRIEQCESSGEWPDLSDTLLPVGLPSWYEPAFPIDA